MSTDALDITVLMGGPSEEREVSLMSGEAVAEALEAAGHRVTRADISPDDVSALERPELDVVFIALHGEFGESGQVQQLCEDRGLTYIGSGPKASAVGLDKWASKAAFRDAGLLTPDAMRLDCLDADYASLGLPVVIKPLDGGSSVGVTICKTAEQRDRAIAESLERYGCTMAEAFCGGRELTVGVLGDRALPVLEVVPEHEFYDYHDKYSDDAKTRYLFEHGLDEATASAVEAQALTAHQAVGCRDLSRVDFILDADGAAWVLEINTIPGFTAHSLVPMAARRVGLDMPALCDHLVQLAWRRKMES